MTVRCLECRTRRATYESLQAHYKASGHAACTCGGLHYPHRPGTRYCDQHPMAGFHRAMRSSEDLSDVELLDILIDDALAFRNVRKLKRPDLQPCPF